MGIRRDIDGLRLQKPGDPAIYLMDQGKKRHIADLTTYNGLFRDWNNVVRDVDTTEIDTGSPIADGTALIQGFGQAEVYLLDVGQGGQIRHIGNPATMDRYDFGWNKIFRVPPAVIASIPTGPAIVWPE